MFDIGFSELMVIGVVALLVLGPERLPKVARTAGHLLGRLQRYVSDVKSDIHREMQLDELKKLQEEARKTAMEFESSVKGEVASLESGLSSVVGSATASVEELNRSIAAPVPADDEASKLLDKQLADARGDEDAAALAFADATPEAAPVAVDERQLGLDFDALPKAGPKT